MMLELVVVVIELELSEVEVESDVINEEIVLDKLLEVDVMTSDDELEDTVVEMLAVELADVVDDTGSGGVHTRLIVLTPTTGLATNLTSIISLSVGTKSTPLYVVPSKIA